MNKMLSSAVTAHLQVGMCLVKQLLNLNDYTYEYLRTPLSTTSNTSQKDKTSHKLLGQDSYISPKSIH